MINVPRLWKKKTILLMAESISCNEHIPARSITSRHIMHASADLAHIINSSKSFNQVLTRTHQHTHRLMALSHILQTHPFLDMVLRVKTPVLIPRPETEHWVGALVERHNLSNMAVLDVGTGTGCIALSIARAYPSCRVTAIDKCAAAIRLARQNAAENNCSANTDFVHCSFAQFVAQSPAKFDLIVSNPPYIPSTRKLPKSVRWFESKAALFSGRDGMDLVRRLIGQSINILRPGRDKTVPFLVTEFDSANESLLNNISNVKLENDQFGYPRTAWFYE